MPLHVNVDLGRRPKPTAAELLEIVREGFGDRFDVYAPGRLQVPDVMVKQSGGIGVAIQILGGRIRKRTRLRVYGLAPSIALRGHTPLGLRQQEKRTRPLVEEVVAFLEGNEKLRTGSA